MIQKLLADTWNGFTPEDIPFLFIQLTASVILTWILRSYWLRYELGTDEQWLVRHMLVLQAVFTLLAVFSQRSAWVAVVFGLILMLLASSGSQLSLKSRMFLILAIGAAWGIGSGNLAVTIGVYLILIWPLLHLASPAKK